MKGIDRIRSLVAEKYSNFNITEVLQTIVLYFSNCDSYEKTLEDLNNEQFLISDEDYEYVVNFLRNINAISSIQVLFSSTELEDEAFHTHYKYLEELCVQNGISCIQRLSDRKEGDTLFIVDIISSINTQKEKFSFCELGDSVFISFLFKCQDDSRLSLASHNNIQDICDDEMGNWPKLMDLLPYYHMYTYSPMRYKSSEELLNIQGQRELMYSFKKGALEFNDPSVLDMLVSEIEEVLYKLFKSNNLPYITWMSIPASTEGKYYQRFLQISEKICLKMNMINGLHFISYGNHSIDSDKLILDSKIIKSDLEPIKIDVASMKGTHVILFDDIVTSGRTAIEMKRILEKAGLQVLCLITVAKTVKIEV